jgi:hypothetical protein
MKACAKFENKVGKEEGKIKELTLNLQNKNGEIK